MHKLLELGNVGRAARCLDSLPLAPQTEATTQRLRELHPSAPPPRAARTDSDTPTANITADAFHEVLDRLPKGKAAGM